MKEPNYKDMTREDFEIMLSAYGWQKIHCADRIWNPVAEENYQKILAMQNALVIGYLATHPKHKPLTEKERTELRSVLGKNYKRR